MNKKNIIVVDLDGTLIPFDSFRLLVLMNILDIRVLFLLFIRIIRIINNSKFKQNIVKILIDKRWDVKNANKFFDKINKHIDVSILKKVQSLCETNDIIILCSASPDIYVSKIAQRLGWIGYGSFGSESPIHLYGINKKNFIISKYPTEKYNYKYSISDNESDLDLLHMFNNWELIKRN